jgi:hypothetical protein
MEQREILEAIEVNELYELVSTRGHEMDKQDLLNIIKELEYASYDNMSRTEKREINKIVVNELNDLWDNPLQIGM